MKKTLLLSLVVLFFSCRSSEIMTDQTKNSQNMYSILALGDSYTIGESVCDTCRFPEQLKDSLLNKIGPHKSIRLNIIAQTGWTTTQLKSEIESQNPSNNYNLVTLLIGVNNQYQNKPFSLYEAEFPELVTTAIQKATGNKDKVIVVSIPDYAYTPFGKENDQISIEINRYNAFAKDYCKEHDITFVNITDLTRLGLDQTDLVAADGLHPSKMAYSKFVERLLPFASELMK